MLCSYFLFLCNTIYNTLMQLILFIYVKWRVHNQGLKREIISSNDTHSRETIPIILDSRVLFRSFAAVSALWVCTCAWGQNKILIRLQKCMRFIPAPQQQHFPVNVCRLRYLVTLHKILMLTNAAVLSRWFIYGRSTAPIVGTAQWLDGPPPPSLLSSSFWHYLPEATPPLFNNIPITCLDLCWTCQ